MTDEKAASILDNTLIENLDRSCKGSYPQRRFRNSRD